MNDTAPQTAPRAAAEWWAAQIADPSFRASALEDDNTTRRVKTFTQKLGDYGAYTIVNLYALRSTDPKALWTHEDPVGPLGDQFIEEQAGARANVIAAWGAHGARNRRGQHIAEQFAAAGVTLHCLGTTGNGQPRHPLYVPGDTPFQPYQAKETCNA